ncbi:MAG TPA: TRAP transporter small permease [Paenalcaligenes sp.]|nr:TRAP transporter small permease [Paenalcaligenes sp.]
MTGQQNSLIIRGLDKVLYILDRVLIALACLALFIIMVIVFFDVLSRYLFNAPFSWSYTLIGFYLMTAVFFFAISDGFRYQAHVKIDFMSHYIPLRLRALAVSLGYFAGAVVIYLWSDQALLRMQSAYLNDDRLAASIPWPTWIAYLIVLIGSIVMALSVLLAAIKYLVFCFSAEVSEGKYKALEGTLLDDAKVNIEEGLL